MTNIVYVDCDLEVIIPVFLQTIHENINEMKEALINKDFKQLEFIGHSLKGVGGGYGFHKVTEFGKKIEKKTIERDTGMLEQLIQELEIYMNNVKIIYVEED